LWLISVDSTGGIAKIPLKLYTSIIVDTYEKRFICSLANQSFIVDLWGCE
jgi:hypothetical protein